jgi:hypothetical protein
VQTALAATFKAAGREEALAEVDGLLKSLNDPYTRLLRLGADSQALESALQNKVAAQQAILLHALRAVPARRLRRGALSADR